MLSFLQIRNFAIVESLDLDFQGGFSAITGETGAGKSIVVDALGLLTGDRADTGSIRSGAEKAELSGQFVLAEGSRALDWLQENEMEDGLECLVRRLINRNGRSRAWINGTMVTLAQLAELGELLVEIHGQNEHIRLVSRREQFRLLDDDPENRRQRQRVHGDFQAWQSLEEERQSLLNEVPLNDGEIELLQYQADELEEGLLPRDEFLRLEAEHRLLARGNEIIQALEHAARELEDDDRNIVQRLTRLADALQPHGELNDGIAETVQMLREATINCQEAAAGVNRASSELDLSPDRLMEIERQLGVQHDLARKHRANPEELDAVLGGLRSRLERAQTLDARLVEIEKAQEQALSAYRRSASALYSARIERAARLAADVTALLQQLGMEGGRFEFLVEHDRKAKPSPHGTDRLELKVSANPGTPPGPLKKVASGGELSRISLAIKVASKAREPAPTQVFDEVDAGIGGETANAVGALLRSLSVEGQALCVTHLAQVAVNADHQFRVIKSAGGDSTSVETSLLDPKSRVDEIARMLGGRISEQSRAHASELLAASDTRH